MSDKPNEESDQTPEPQFTLYGVRCRIAKLETDHVQSQWWLLKDTVPLLGDVRPIDGTGESAVVCD